MTHNVVETIKMVDGSLKDFYWKSDDFNAIGLYWESRGAPNEVVKIKIDNKETDLKEADEIIYKWDMEIRKNEQNRIQ